MSIHVHVIYRETATAVRIKGHKGGIELLSM